MYQKFKSGADPRRFDEGGLLCSGCPLLIRTGVWLLQTLLSTFWLQHLHSPLQNLPEKQNQICFFPAFLEIQCHALQILETTLQVLTSWPKMAPWKRLQFWPKTSRKSGAKLRTKDHFGKQFLLRWLDEEMTLMVQFSVTVVVNHSPQIPENSDWDVNGKRFWFVPLENSWDKRKFWKGSPVFPIGTFRMEICLPFTSFLSFVPVSCYN